jgi:hypothetical protein
MNYQKLIDQLVTPLVAGFVTLARLSFPTASDIELTADIDGELKHALRRKIGWAVDILWGISEFKNALDTVISDELAATAGNGPLPSLDLNPVGMQHIAS